MLLFGGSEPPLGLGGRSIFAYTPYKLVLERCAAETCLVDKDFQGNTLLIYCDGPACEREIHKYCDEKVRNVKKLPAKYYCPYCTMVSGYKRPGKSRGK